MIRGSGEVSWRAAQQFMLTASETRILEPIELNKLVWIQMLPWELEAPSRNVPLKNMVTPSLFNLSVDLSRYQSCFYTFDILALFDKMSMSRFLSDFQWSKVSEPTPIQCSH